MHKTLIVILLGIILIAIHGCGGNKAGYNTALRNSVQYNILNKRNHQGRSVLTNNHTNTNPRMSPGTSSISSKTKTTYPSYVYKEKIVLDDQYLEEDFDKSEKNERDIPEKMSYNSPEKSNIQDFIASQYSQENLNQNYNFGENLAYENFNQNKRSDQDVSQENFIDTELPEEVQHDFCQEDFSSEKSARHEGGSQKEFFESSQFHSPFFYTRQKLNRTNLFDKLWSGLFRGFDSHPSSMNDFSEYFFDCKSEHSKYYFFGFNSPNGHGNGFKTFRFSHFENSSLPNYGTSKGMSKKHIIPNEVRDAYNLLDVKPLSDNFTKEEYSKKIREIDKKYRSKIRQVHPDKNKNSNDDFAKDLNRAKSILYEYLETLMVK